MRVFQGERRYGVVAALSLCSVAFVFTLLCGCHEGDVKNYVAPPDADAQLVVHAQDDTYDVFLDGRLLGRISWAQPYKVTAGDHVLRAKQVTKIMPPADASFPFTIYSGETVHFAIYERDPSEDSSAGTVIYESPDIRIERIVS